jgi:carboxymethylenebutenolidase
MELSMTALTPDQRAMLAIWQQHTHAEFGLKDADAALATMTENPYAFLVASGAGRNGRAAVHEFCAQEVSAESPGGS